jgi:cytoskeletal protein CcmA (bactofilin family)
MKLEGELVGDSDVEIRGQLDGNVRVDGHLLVVAETGRVVAEVSARAVRILGQVVGNVTASEQIMIEASGCVLGDICAPSIRLEDGSRFTGSINKDTAPAKVTGRLNGASADPSRQADRQATPVLAQRQNVPDRRGARRPWDHESDRRSET